MLHHEERSPEHRRRRAPSTARAAPARRGTHPGRPASCAPDARGRTRGRPGRSPDPVRCARPAASAAVSPASLHDAANSTVSLDIPLVLGASNSTIVGVASSGSTVVSHASSAWRVASGSRVEVCGSPTSSSAASSAVMIVLRPPKTCRGPTSRPRRPRRRAARCGAARAASPRVRRSATRPVGERHVEVVQRDVAGAVEHLLAGRRHLQPRDATVGARRRVRSTSPSSSERPDVATRGRLVDLEPASELGTGDRSVPLDDAEREQPGAADRRADGTDDPLVLTGAARARRDEHREVVDREEVGVGGDPRSASPTCPRRRARATPCARSSRSTPRPCRR